jgi:WD40 repeat protein
LPDSSILVAAIDEEDEPNPDQFSARHVEWSLDAKQLVVRTVFHQTREKGAHDNYQGPDSQVIILDASQPELIAELDVDSDFLSERGLAVCSQWIATGGDDVDVWYLKNGESLHLLESTDFCQSVCFSPDEMYLATTHNGGNICVWETHEWLDNITWQAHKNVTRGIAFHPTLPILASFGDDAVIKVWSLETSSPEQMAQIEMERDIEGLAFNPAGTQLYITANYPAPAVSIYDLP